MNCPYCKITMYKSSEHHICTKCGERVKVAPVEQKEDWNAPLDKASKAPAVTITDLTGTGMVLGNIVVNMIVMHCHGVTEHNGKSVYHFKPPVATHGGNS